MKTLQAQSIFIGPNREHPESKAGAYMTRLLENLTEQQKKDVYWLRDKWRSREEATDLDCFQVGKKLQELCQSTPIDFAQAAYGQKKHQGGTPNQRNTCGVAHGGRSSHSWAECFSNPINAKKKAEYFAKLNCGSRGKPINNSTSVLEAKLAAAQALRIIYNNKTRVPHSGLRNGTSR